MREAPDDSMSGDRLLSGAWGDRRTLKAIIKVEIPLLPGPGLNPNYHGHWRKRYHDSKILKRSAYYCTKAANPEDITLDPATVQVTFKVRDWRFARDADNAIASVKSAIDGCVMAGLLPDDKTENLQYRLPVMFEKDKELAPMTILEFKGKVVT